VGSEQFWQNDFPRKNEWSQRSAKTAAEADGTRPGIPCSPCENSLFGRKNSLFREQQGIACKLLKLLKDSPPRGRQGIPRRRLKLLDELAPTIAEMAGNFANSLLFSLLPGN